MSRARGGAVQLISAEAPRHRLAVAQEAVAVVVLDPEHVPDVMSDASLVADAQRGSTAAFAALYELSLIHI